MRYLIAVLVLLGMATRAEAFPGEHDIIPAAPGDLALISMAVMGESVGRPTSTLLAGYEWRALHVRRADPDAIPDAVAQLNTQECDGIGCRTSCDDGQGKRIKLGAIKGCFSEEAGASDFARMAVEWIENGRHYALGLNRQGTGMPGAKARLIVAATAAAKWTRDAGTNAIAPAELVKNREVVDEAHARTLRAWKNRRR